MVLAAYSGTAEMLSITRAVLDVAGAKLAPSTLSLIRNMFRNPGWKTSVLESSPLWRSVLRRYLA